MSNELAVIALCQTTNLNVVQIYSVCNQLCFDLSHSLNWLIALTALRKETRRYPQNILRWNE